VENVVSQSLPISDVKLLLMSSIEGNPGRVARVGMQRNLQQSISFFFYKKNVRFVIRSSSDPQLLFIKAISIVIKTTSQNSASHGLGELHPDDRPTIRSQVKVNSGSQLPAYKSAVYRWWT
jgi:hypothetical protein